MSAASSSHYKYSRCQQQFIKAVDFGKPKDFITKIKSFGIIKMNEDEKVHFPNYILYLHDNFSDAFIKWKQWVEGYSADERETIVELVKLTKAEKKLYRENKQKLLEEQRSFISSMVSKTTRTTTITPTQATRDQEATPIDRPPTVTFTHQEAQSEPIQGIHLNNNGNPTALDVIAESRVRAFAKQAQMSKRRKTQQQANRDMLDDDEDDEEALADGRAPGDGRAAGDGGGRALSLFDEQHFRDETNEKAKELRKPSNKRCLGEHATSVYQQSDQRAIASIEATLKTCAKALDTCFFEMRQKNEPQVALMFLALNEIKRVGSDGGSVGLDGVRAIRPQLIVLTRNTDDVVKLMDAFHSSTRKDKAEREKYQFIPLVENEERNGTSMMAEVESFLEEANAARQQPKETEASNDDVLDSIEGQSAPLSSP